MSDTFLNPLLRDRNEDDLRRAQERHAKRLRDQKKARDALRQLEAQRGYFYEDDED